MLSNLFVTVNLRINQEFQNSKIQIPTFEKMCLLRSLKGWFGGLLSTLPLPAKEKITIMPELYILNYQKKLELAFFTS